MPRVASIAGRSGSRNTAFKPLKFTIDFNGSSDGDVVIRCSPAEDNGIFRIDWGDGEMDLIFSQETLLRCMRRI